MHIVLKLRERMREVEPYPEGVVGVPEALPFTAFFPGGHGLWMNERELPPMPDSPIMIVGHNFHNVAGYEKMRARNGRDANSPTWRNLMNTLCSADIAPQVCFFTNAYMGLMNTASAQGIFPGAHDADFVSRCQTFFCDTLRLLRPRLIVTLGAHVPPFLAPLSPQLRASWLNTKGRYVGLQELDAHDAALQREVTFNGVSGAFRVVALTHPAQLWPNVRRRRYNGRESYAAEDALLRDGLEVSA